MSKVDSNLTGLRYAEEASIGVLPGSPVWFGLEPNSYGDFGAEITTMARAPIVAGRQRKKGVVVDLDATADFEVDLTQTNLYNLLPGFMFTSWRAKQNGVISSINAATDTLTLASGTVRVGDMVFITDLGVPANNGITRATAVTGLQVTVAKDIVADTPTAASRLRVVGFQFASGDATITIVGGVPQLNATAKDLTQLGLIPGEWVYIGGVTAATRFDTTACNGFARVAMVAANRITFDKTAGVMVADAGAGKTIQVFTGDAIKNESDPSLIVRRSFQLERALSTAGYEYVRGSVPNELTLNLSMSDKVTMSMAFVATDSEQITDPLTPKTGARPAIPTEDAFNTSSDIGRIRIAGTGLGTAPLAAFMMSASLTISNGVTPNKALGVLGAFDLTAGNFEVQAELETYFSTLAAVQAVRNNADATFDFVLTKANAGWLFDLPLVALGNGRLGVEKDQPIKLPLTADAAESSFGHTMLAQRFWYLPV